MKYPYDKDNEEATDDCDDDHDDQDEIPDH